MKICFICGEYPPGPQGGIGTVVQLAARKLVTLGHEIKVIGTYNDDRYPNDFYYDEGVEVHRIRDAGKGLPSFAMACYKQFSHIRKWINDNEVEIVEAPESRGWFAFWPPLKAPCVIRAHGSETHEKLTLGIKPNSLTRYLEQRSHNRAQACSAVSKYAADAAISTFHLRGNIPVIYNGIEFMEVPQQQRLPNTLVFAGTLNEKKGAINLIKAAIKLHQQNREFTLNIFGKDTTYNGASMVDYLRGMMPEDMLPKVNFKGHVTRSELFSIYATCTMAVFPSQWESFGLAPVEAMMCGCPVIHTTIPTGYELIRDGEGGLLVDPYSANDLADKIDLLLRDEALRVKIGNNGILKVKNNFTVEVMCERLMEFYKKTIEEFKS